MVAFSAHKAASIPSGLEKEEKDYQLVLLDQCWEYFQTFQYKTGCFQDLRPYIVTLSETRQIQFGARISALSLSLLPGFTEVRHQ